MTWAMTALLWEVHILPRGLFCGGYDYLRALSLSNIHHSTLQTQLSTEPKGRESFKSKLKTLIDLNLETLCSLGH